MAINKITAGLASGPSAFAQPVLNQLAAMLTVASSTKRASGGYILKGALFNIGGSMFMADSDTAISGTASDYIKLTVSGEIASAAYTADVSGVSWNGLYQGCFDISGNLYITDEQYGIRPPYEVLSGIGTYTVPTNVFNLHIKMYGPGEDGDDHGGGGRTGAGGASGELVEMNMDVIPLETYSYSVTSVSTVFDSTTAEKGKGIPTSEVQSNSYGTCGAGYGGGAGGVSRVDGSDATGTYGGGGGGAGSYAYGGSGALGRIEIS